MPTASADDALEEPAPDPENTARDATAQLPSTEPAPQRPDPPPISHAPAQQVLVVLADKTFTPGKLDIDRQPGYRTLVWTRSAGALPEQGPAAATIVEELPGLWASDGAALWELRIEAKAVEYPKCNCEAVQDERDDIIGKGVIRKSFDQLVAVPRGGGQERTLIGATDFHVESTDDCLSHAGELERSWQLVAIAGPHLLYVDKVFDEGICGMVTQWTILDMKIASLTGQTDLAALEAQLPVAAVASMRKRAARALADEVLGDESGVSEDDLAPAALLLTAIFPGYRSGKRYGLQLQYDVQSCHLCVGEQWTDGHYAVRSSTEHVDSSLLSPPEDVRALLDYAGREYGKLTPIGWSRKR